ncbi:MAG: cation acetate symporter [Pseudomonadota bacterium]
MNNKFLNYLIPILTLTPSIAWGAESESNLIAIGCFFGIIAISLFITYWAAGRTRSAKEFYVADSSISGTQNGIAIAGDFLSAATVLGVSALIFINGYDAILYLMAGGIAFAFMLFFMTDKLKEMGTYSFSDVVCARLEPRPMRTLAACSALSSAMIYLVGQMVGAGALIQVLFGMEYRYAVILVGALMMIYVAVGGMFATTWVQIVKAVMLIIGLSLLSLLILAHFQFDFGQLYASALAKHSGGEIYNTTGGFQLDFIASLSLLLGLAFGLTGSPHLLMRFFTVPDAKAARQSAVVAIVLITFVNVLIFFVIGPAAIALISGNESFMDANGGIIGGTNMVAIHLSQVLGGQLLLGVMSAVAFATILAVVAGLTLASASAISHDLYANVWHKGDTNEQNEVMVSRIAVVGIGIVSITLGIAFEGENIAYLIALALAVAASTNFPLLLYAMYWEKLTTRGALFGGTIGLVLAIGLIVLGPAVWVNVFGFAEPIFPYNHPALYSMSAAFFFIWLFSVTDSSKAKVAENG